MNRVELDRIQRNIVDVRVEMNHMAENVSLSSRINTAHYKIDDVERQIDQLRQLIAEQNKFDITSLLLNIAISFCTTGIGSLIAGSLVGYLKAGQKIPGQNYTFESRILQYSSVEQYSKVDYKKLNNYLSVKGLQIDTSSLKVKLDRKREVNMVTVGLIAGERKHPKDLGFDVLKDSLEAAISSPLNALSNLLSDKSNRDSFAYQAKQEKKLFDYNIFVDKHAKEMDLFVDSIKTGNILYHEALSNILELLNDIGDNFTITQIGLLYDYLWYHRTNPNCSFYADYKKNLDNMMNQFNSDIFLTGTTIYEANYQSIVLPRLSSIDDVVKFCKDNFESRVTPLEAANLLHVLYEKGGTQFLFFKNRLDNRNLLYIFGALRHGTAWQSLTRTYEMANTNLKNSILPVKVSIESYHDHDPLFAMADYKQWGHIESFSVKLHLIAARDSHWHPSKVFLYFEREELISSKAHGVSSYTNLYGCLKEVRNDYGFDLAALEQTRASYIRRSKTINRAFPPLDKREDLDRISSGLNIEIVLPTHQLPF